MYIRISKEDIEKAKNVDLIELLESKYPNTFFPKTPWSPTKQV